MTAAWLHCTPPDPRPVLGVIGVFTVDDGNRRLLRDEIRATWLSTAFLRQGGSVPRSQRLTARFVARGAGPGASALRAEALVSKDFVFLDANASLARGLGPLLTLLEWWACATVAWPSAQYIGKADDDVWIDMPAVSAHIHATHTILHARHRGTAIVPRIYWGLFETFHWMSEEQEAAGWSYGWGRGHPRRCERRREPVHPPPRQSSAAIPTGDSTSGASSGTAGTVPAASAPAERDHEVVGPFFFAKGPLFLLSSALISELLGSGELRARVHAVLAQKRLTDGGKRPPWEDAFTGLELATRVAEDPRSKLYYVHHGATAFAEGWGAYGHHLRRNTLVWHENFKWPGRLAVVHMYAQRHRCVHVSAQTLRLDCSALPDFTSCANASWARCQVSDDTYAPPPLGVNCTTHEDFEYIRRGCAHANRTDPSHVSVCKEAWHQEHRPLAELRAPGESRRPTEGGGGGGGGKKALPSDTPLQVLHHSRSPAIDGARAADASLRSADAEDGSDSDAHELSRLTARQGWLIDELRREREAARRARAEADALREELHAAHRSQQHERSPI